MSPEARHVKDARTERLHGTVVISRVLRMHEKIKLHLCAIDGAQKVDRARLGAAEVQTPEHMQDTYRLAVGRHFVRHILSIPHPVHARMCYTGERYHTQ